MAIPRTAAAIILAAGSSSRMGAGRHKLLLPLAGRPVLAHVIDAALASKARPIIIVLGHQGEQVRAQISSYREHSDITLVENPDYLQGMSTSLHMGLRTLLVESSAQTSTSSLPSSALVMLGDQPLMTPEIIDTLISRWQTAGKLIVAPLYAGKRGNPVLFDARLFTELLATTGDEGGRSVIERHRQEVTMVEMGDARASYDVDTWDAYQQVVEAWEGKR